MARLRIRQGDLIEALENHSYDFSWVLDLVTGEIVYVPTDVSFHDVEEWQELYEQIASNPERYRAIEPLPSRVGYGIMEDFTATLPDSHMKEHLFRALSSRHPFLYFKDVLCEDEELRQAYFAYREAQLLLHAQRWLADEEIDAELIPYDIV